MPISNNNLPQVHNIQEHCKPKFKPRERTYEMPETEQNRPHYVREVDIIQRTAVYQN